MFLVFLGFFRRMLKVWLFSLGTGPGCGVSQSEYFDYMWVELHWVVFQLFTFVFHYLFASQSRALSEQPYNVNDNWIKL